MALVCEPPLVVLDEPTTGLDVVTQARILDEIDGCARDRRLAMVYVTHDLAVVGEPSPTAIAVMYAGRIVEEGADRGGPGAAASIPYTRGLVASIPDHLASRAGCTGMPGIARRASASGRQGCAFAPRCAQRRSAVRRRACRRSRSSSTGGTRPLLRVAATHRPLVLEPCLDRRAAREADAAAGPTRRGALRAEHRSPRGAAVAGRPRRSRSRSPRGECSALVGESGSGKTTIARCVAGLHAADCRPDHPRRRRRSPGARGVAPRDARRRIQIVFQNPYDSLNPRQRVADEIARPARILRGLTRARGRATRSPACSSASGCRRALATAFPASSRAASASGSRSRARSPRTRTPGLRRDHLRARRLGAGRGARAARTSCARARARCSSSRTTSAWSPAIADRVLVLEHGLVCEEGATSSVLEAPTHPYTQRLLAAAPRLPDPV